MEELIRLTLNCNDNSSDINKGVHNFVEITFNDNDNIVQVIMIILAVVEIEIVIVYTMISNNNDASDAVVIIHT